MAAAPGPGPAASHADALQRCCSLIREAVADSGSAAAALVPLRPSLRRIKDDLVRVLDEAISSHNGNTALLVLGPPGTGKTLVVERALREVTTKHNSPASLAAAAAASSSAAAAAGPSTSAAPPPEPPTNPTATNQLTVAVVRLHGLLQPDERTAFQEVARQLCRQFGHKAPKSATFDENLVFLKGMLHALYKCLKKVVFVIDEFQQYAKKGKQQMLYYLLDLLQDSQIQAAVLGLSSAHNVADDLEKRVLSRVGRRRVLVTFPAPPDPAADELDEEPSGGASTSASPVACPPACDSYEGLLSDMLCMHPGMERLVGGQQGQGPQQGQGGRGAGAAGGAAAAAAAGADVSAAHNAAVAAALRDSRVQEGLSKLARLGAPPQHLALVAESALVAWGADLDAWQRQQQQQQQQDAPAGRRGQGAGGGGGSSAPPLLGAQHVAEALREVTEVPERSMVDAVAGLSVLQLLLLVAAHRLQRKGQPMCNFEMAWEEYRSMQGGRGAVSFTKAAAEAAWQGLLLSGVAHAADPHLEDRSRDLAYAGVLLLLCGQELEAGIRQHPHCPDAVLAFHRQEV